MLGRHALSFFGYLGDNGVHAPYTNPLSSMDPPRFSRTCTLGMNVDCVQFPLTTNSEKFGAGFSPYWCQQGTLILRRSACGGCS